ncbi:unnamed protein product [Urochloa decumbens]|uniref:Uncharacterized protein n=1 Tax=Urochloa decumbens TaxID=240449 RepID=A0ABC9ANH2_9POAL
MDPSVCRLHPGVAVTGFCPACLRDRLAGLQPPPSSADLRRCKSFSYARSAAAVEPQRRSCDLFSHQQPNNPMAAAVPEEADYQYDPYQEEAADGPQEQQGGAYSYSSRNNKSSLGLGGLLGRKLQQWRRKSKKLEPEEMPVVGRQLQRHRPSCDEGPVLARIPAAVLSSLFVEEEDDGTGGMTAMRSDGQIPVEEEQDYYLDTMYGYDNAPGGTAQTRDYYLDSSSSSRRRRSVDSRNSFSSDAINDSLGATAAATNGGNARVSPAVAAETERPLYHHHYHEAQSVLIHHHQYSQKQQPRASATAHKKQGIRGWSIWGLLNKKKKQQQQPPDDLVQQQAAGEYYYPWPELRARGYNGQMLRCNSSISARSSFSGGAAMIGGSGRRSVSGVDMRDAVIRDGERRTRRDEHLLLERTRSSLSSYSRSSAGHGHGHGLGLDPATASRPPNIPRRSASSKHHDSMHRRSTLGL